MGHFDSPGPEGRLSIMRTLADRPEEVPAVFAERFNSGDPDALAQVYEDAAVLVPQPGAPATGPELRAANGRLQRLGVPISVRPRHVYRNGDLALLIVDWVIDGTDPEGRPVHVEGTATDVVRRGPDGRWRYVIDNPFGPAHSEVPVDRGREDLDVLDGGDLQPDADRLS
ncbi:YybH family protein [Streptomyces sp. NPDC053750]|uniref:YybH family protein n=1 Tax=Streptomyces sp. NPDC053750 TaxID=3365714 RepID=UPI0037D34C71